VLIQRLVPALVESTGVLIDVTSPVALVDPRRPAGEGGWGVAYAASKAAFHRVAGVLAVEQQDSGLRIYNLDPGHVVTEGQMVSAARAGRQPTGEPPEVPAATIVWLVKDGEEQRALVGKTVQAQATCRRLGLVPGWPPDGEA
jgi:NAD(P)-dependent dehydrogenase (short-subunit alcohol dehydrogenase family)